MHDQSVKAGLLQHMSVCGFITRGKKAVIVLKLRFCSANELKDPLLAIQAGVNLQISMCKLL